MFHAKSTHAVVSAISAMMTFVVGCSDSDGERSSRSSQSLTVPLPTINQYVVMASRNVTVGQRADVTGGDVGVAATATNTFTGNIDGTAAVGEVLIAPRVVLLDRFAAGEIGANFQSIAPSATTGPRSAYVAPPAQPVPTGSFTPGTMNVTVNTGVTQTLAAGSFASVNVSGILNLSGGTYTFANLRLNPDARLIALASSTVRVQTGIAAADRSRLQAPAPQPAGNLRLVVNGTIDGPTNSLSLGTDVQLRALVVARNVFVTGDRLIGSGAVAAQDVILGNDATLAFNTGFGCATAADCNDNNTCTTDSCVNAACVNAAAPNGSVCSDGNACTQTDTCQAGVCTGANPVVCTAQDQCHVAGTCNPANGMCSNPNAPNGTVCSDANACTQTDTCQTGVCTGGNPVVCMAADQCHDAGICNPANGMCSNPNRPNGTPCTDGNACTQMDTCQSGACTGGPGVTCPTPDQCHDPGTCNPMTGTCSNPEKPNGTPCSDENGCTQADACQAGMCQSGAPVVCTASNDCHDPGTCDPSTGECSDPAKPDGTPCSDGSLCTQSDVCQMGECEGGSEVMCTASDQCHDVGTCDPATGVCSDPAKPDGSPCDDGSECSIGDACQGGTCEAGGDFAVAEFTTGLTQPSSIISGPLGRLWFVSREATPGYSDGSVASITTAGAVSNNPALFRDPYVVIVGPDGLLWLAERILGSPHIGHFNTATSTYGADWPLGLLVNDMASVNESGTAVAYLTAGSSVVRVNNAGGTLSTTATLSVARAITVASTGSTVWFTQAANSGVARIGRLTFPTLAQFAVNTTGELADIAEGSDGGIWFTDTGANRVARLSSDGATLDGYPLPTAAATPYGITSGPDGNLWFTMRDANKIGLITTSGEITEICIPTAASGPTSIAAGPDGNIWFTEASSGKIGRVSLTVMAAAPESEEVATSEAPAAGDSGCTISRRSSSNGALVGWVLALGLLAGARRRRAGAARPS